MGFFRRLFAPKTLHIGGRVNMIGGSWKGNKAVIISWSNVPGLPPETYYRIFVEAYGVYSDAHKEHLKPLSSDLDV